MQKSLAWFGSAVSLCVLAGVGCGGTSADVSPANEKPVEPLSPGDSGTSDASDAAQAAPTLYFGNAYLADLFVTFNGQPADRYDRTFKFYTELQYDAVTKTISRVRLTSIKSDASTIASSDTIGAAATADAVQVSSTGKFVAKLGTITIPPEANPSSQREVVIENAVVTGVFKESGRFCSILTGNIVTPTTLTLSGIENVVLYDPVTEGATQPVHAKPDFDPGCPIPAE